MRDVTTLDIGFIEADRDHIKVQVNSRDRLVDISPAPCITDADREAHRAFVATLDDKPIWNETFGDAQNRHQRRLAAERA